MQYFFAHKIKCILREMSVFVISIVMNYLLIRIIKTHIYNLETSLNNANVYMNFL